MIANHLTRNMPRLLLTMGLLPLFTLGFAEDPLERVNLKEIHGKISEEKNKAELSYAETKFFKALFEFEKLIGFTSDKTGQSPFKTRKEVVYKGRLRSAIYNDKPLVVEDQQCSVTYYSDPSDYGDTHLYFRAGWLHLGTRMQNSQRVLSTIGGNVDRTGKRFTFETNRRESRSEMRTARLSGDAPLFNFYYSKTDRSLDDFYLDFRDDGLLNATATHTSQRSEVLIVLPYSKSYTSSIECADMVRVETGHISQQ